MKGMLLLLSCWLLADVTNARDFVTRWTFPAAQSTISFYASSEGPVNYTWTSSSTGGSGSFFGGSGGTLLPVLLNIPIAAGDLVTLSMAPANLRQFSFWKDNNTLYDARFLTDVSCWGAVPWSSMNHAFSLCRNLNITASDLPDLRSVKDMSYMFNQAELLNGPANINSWDVSQVTDMSNMFRSAYVFNQDISDWETGKVTNMFAMFQYAGAFNQDIGNWNTGKVADMSNMFEGAEVFNRYIGDWNTGNVTDMSYMFQGAHAFNQDIGNWETGKVTDMSSMFVYASVFNQYIGNWNTVNVTNMAEMFGYADAFNQYIGDWNTGNVTDMSGMFRDAELFNQYIGNWNTGNVITMFGMFAGAKAFNQDISNWNTGNVVNMGFMFQYAEAFNQYISNWNTSNVINMSYMFYDASVFNQNLGTWNLNSLEMAYQMFAFSGLNCENYSLILKDWAENTTTPANVAFTEQNGMVYAHMAIPYRDALIANRWDFSEDVEVVPGSPCYNMVLLVAVGSISAVFKNGQLLVHWQTLTETNNDHFEIEASVNGKNFAKIGEVKSLTATGNSSIALDYSFSKDVSVATNLLGVALLALALIGANYNSLQRCGRRKAVQILAAAGVLIVTFAACIKNNAGTISTMDTDLLIRIKQVDKDGKFKYSKTIKVIK